jgi:hypothetical protein
MHSRPTGCMYENVLPNNDTTFAYNGSTGSDINVRTDINVKPDDDGSNCSYINVKTDINVKPDDDDSTDGEDNRRFCAYNNN